MNDALEVSFVMPCLDEAETLENCIRAAQACIAEHGLKGEVVIADNGSTDGSREIASRAGARVVDVPERGYGAALMGGFEAARGRYLIMGDADESYDFGEAIGLIEELRAGADLVMGSRFLGRIEPGAMPWIHRWLGNPVLSFVGRLFFRTKISDFHCGLRGLTKSTYEALQLRTSGMEFASEMVVKAAARGHRIAEVPITLRPDGRSRPPHLRTWRDGWRHLRFLMTLSPGWTLFAPGLLLMVLGGIALGRLAVGPLWVGEMAFDVHTMQIAALLVVVGFQAVTTAVAARIYVVAEEIGPASPWMWKAFEVFTLERGLIAGALMVAVGAFLCGNAAWGWFAQDFGPLKPTVSLRPVVVGTTLLALGAQTVLMSFLYSMLGIQRRTGKP